jgi:hypothetical protein
MTSDNLPEGLDTDVVFFDTAMKCEKLQVFVADLRAEN